jgi:hypothetical protein
LTDLIIDMHVLIIALLLSVFLNAHDVNDIYIYIYIYIYICVCVHESFFFFLFLPQKVLATYEALQYYLVEDP